MTPMSLSDLDLDSLAPGAHHRLWLEVAHDGLGKPIEMPVLVCRGRQDGPVCGLTAAVHGNEVNGIPAIHSLFSRLDPARLKGTVVGVPVVNVPGYLLHQRRTDDGLDLNHLFPGKPEGREGEVLAHRIFHKIIARLDLLLDLHTASFGRINTLYVRADMTNPKTRQMALLQRPRIIVHNPPADGTLRGAAHAAGVAAVTVEIGNPHRYQREVVQRTVVGVRHVLGAWGMLPKRAVANTDPPVVCKRSGWIYTDHGGFLDVLPDAGELVEAGQEIARIRDAFGDTVRSYAAPHAGIVIGKSVDPVASTGARVLHLGELGDPMPDARLEVHR